MIPWHFAFISQQTDLYGIFVPVSSEAMNTEEWNQHEKDSPFKNQTVDDMQDDMFNEIFEKATEVMFILSLALCVLLL